ncbi:NADPH-dependent F420 reductase [Martelella endophytica]|uniref:Transmembrane reductase oxidoreductase n=1 Tax=Martelella endophytica TaxID=1486262 RepID=A0A0D5LMH8_MAREN|nr:NAD(P)-binding domain-containing protein [Martelella endophytica]AJY44972.1 transmembrane reductase oxidoreductase [Martelella endophytica]
MKIAILGSGRMGAALGQCWSACGHDVVFSYSRSDGKLARLADASGADWASVGDAVRGADAILLAVHWSRVDDVLDQAGDLSGIVALNCCVPLDASDSELVVGMNTSGAEALARRRPDARWIGCFNTSPSEAIPAVFERRGKAERPHMMFYGDDRSAKALAAGLIGDIGFEALDTGGLRNARFIEPFAMATVELAYVQPGGPELTYRFQKMRSTAHNQGE